MGVAMNTVGVDTSLTTFSPASAPSSKSRSTIVQLYGVDTHALTAAERDDQIIGFAHGQPLKRLLRSNGPLRPVCMSTFSITALAEDASSTRSRCAGSPNRLQ